MGEVRGFLKYDRVEKEKEDISSRIEHFNEFMQIQDESVLKLQGARCMDCGVPFCQSGCPVDNLIPEWNDLIYRNRWKEAAERLLSTNNFPEFTGRVCPAPCENSCVVSINMPAVSIKNIELAIIENAYKSGLIKANPPKNRSGKIVAVVGSGPSGLATAEQLNKMGHSVTVYEKNEVLGGLLALGIPDFKLEKRYVERRIKIMQQEGIQFKTSVNVGKDILLSELQNSSEAVVLCGGAEEPRDLNIPGRELKGVHFAMDFLTQQNRRSRNTKSNDQEISAKGKRVVVIGGGDTGSDCIGTSIRQGAKSVINLELFPKPPKERANNNPWPEWARIERVSTSIEEGCKQEYAVMTKEFAGSGGNVQKLKVVRLAFGIPDSKTGRMEMSEIPNSEIEIEADLVILALGFLGPKHNHLIEELNLKTDNKSNILTDDKYMTNVEGIFSAGDMRTGQSLVVRAINDGRRVAEKVNQYLHSSKKT